MNLLLKPCTTKKIHLYAYTERFSENTKGIVIIKKSSEEKMATEK